MLSRGKLSDRVGLGLRKGKNIYLFGISNFSKSADGPLKPQRFEKYLKLQTNYKYQTFPQTYTHTQLDSNSTSKLRHSWRYTFPISNYSRAADRHYFDVYSLQCLLQIKMEKGSVSSSIVREKILASALL